MFTVKVFPRKWSGGHRAYEAKRYQVSYEGFGEIVFEEPNDTVSTALGIGQGNERIVVENQAGKTIENIAWWPGLSWKELTEED